MRRFLLTMLIAAYAVLAAWVYVSQRAPTGSSRAQMESHLRWARNQPEVWEQIGRSVLFDPTFPDPKRAEAAFLRAAQENPMEPEIWTDLADTYLQMDQPQKAESATRTALLVYPRSPAIAWRLANTLVLEGRTADSLPLLKIAATSDPGQQYAVYDLGWKLLGSGEAVLKNVVPDDLESRAAYLSYMLEKGAAQTPSSASAFDSRAPSSVWQELRRGQYPETERLGYRLVETLLNTSRTREAAGLWTDLLAYTGRAAAQPAGTLMSNGGFELDMPGEGLDWHLQQDPHWTASLDNFTPHNGSRSLLFSFDGKSNPGFDGLWQWVIVEPNRGYRLQAFVKTDNVVSDNGFQLVVGSYRSPAAESFTTLGPMHLGTDPWTEDTISFRIGPHTTVVRVGLHRTVSQKLYGQLGGRVWVDDFRVEGSR